MSSIAAHSEVQLSPALESDQETFYRLLFHDDKEGNLVLFTRDSGVYHSTTLKAASLPDYQFDAGSNYYITHNSFYGRRRLSLRTKQLNALFFDIDCHEEPSQAKREALIALIQERLANAILEERLPMPTIIVDSGRGIQLYFVLRRSIPYQLRKEGLSSEKGVKFYEDVQRRLADVLEEQMEGLEHVEIDRTIFDHSRVGRIPDTFNSKAGRNARLVNACELFYDLPVLATYYPAKKRIVSPAKTPKKAKHAFVLKFNALMMARLNKVSELQEYRKYNCEGNRELMCFVYYNTAVQIYDRNEAVQRLSAFNKMFQRPLPEQELKGVINSVDRVVNVKGERGYYLLSAKTVIECLGLTEKEIEDTGFFMSKRAAERLVAKLNTKEKREARNRRIVELYQRGGMTQQQIAEVIGCSVRTVHSVLKEAGATKTIITKHKKTTRTSITLMEAARAALKSASQIADQPYHALPTAICNFMSHELEGSLPKREFLLSSTLELPLRFPFLKPLWLFGSRISLDAPLKSLFRTGMFSISSGDFATWMMFLPHRPSLDYERRWLNCPSFTQIGYFWSQAHFGFAQCP